MTLVNNLDGQGRAAPAIFIAGYYGFKNAGDEAILEGILGSIRAQRPGTRFVVASGDPDSTMRSYSVEAVRWADLDQVINVMSTCDLVLVGGGGLFCDYWGSYDTLLTRNFTGISNYSSFAILAHLLGKPFVTYSVGVGPFDSEAGKKITRQTLLPAEALTVRDPESARELIELGLPAEKVVVCADPAFLLRPDRDQGREVLCQAGIEDDGKKPLLGVNLRRWGREEEQDHWGNEIAQALDAWMDQNQGNVVFVPFQILDDGFNDDLNVVRNIVGKMRHSSSVIVLDALYSPAVIAGIFSHCDLLLGMRFHAVLLAALSNVPSVALSYDPKVENLMRLLGMQPYSISLMELDGPHLVRVLAGVFQERQRLSQGIEQARPLLEEKAQSATDLVLQVFDATVERHDPQIDSQDSFIKDLLVKQTRMLDKALVELEEFGKLKALNIQLQNELGLIRASKTFRLAQMLSAVGNRFFPRDSKQRYVLSWIARDLRRIKNEGAISYLRDTYRLAIAGIEQRRALRNILAQYPDVNGVIIILPSVGWDVALFQRPQQMALAYARQNYLVFYCEAALTPVKGFEPIGMRLYKYQGPLEIFDQIRNPIVNTYTYNARFVRHFKNARVIYEYIDDLEVFPHDLREMQHYHRIMCRDANIIVTTARKLYDQVKPVRPDVLLNPNAVDYEHFAPARSKDTPLPVELQPIVEKRQPVIGYYGALARWFDYAFLKAVAALRPNYQFVLIGLDYDRTLIPSRLLEMPNVHWLGVKPYQELPKYLAHFNVAMIPFVISEITHSTSPIKLFEYMAGHKPVVVTPMKESLHTPGVLTGGTPHEFARSLDEALKLQSDPSYLELSDKVAQENTWDTRVRQVLDAISLDK